MHLLPLFPLPSTVFFPKMVLPLHVFEDRYRELVKDVLLGEGLIGVPLLKPDDESVDEGKPEIFPVLGYGSIQHSEALADGKYNIVLKGLGRVRIVRELQSDLLYRIAEVEGVPDLGPSDPTRLAPQLKRLKEHFLPLLPLYLSLPEDFRETMARIEDPELFCHLLAMHLIEESLERQNLLEAPGLGERLTLLEKWMGLESLRHLKMKHELG